MKRLGIDFGTSFVKLCDAQKEELIALDKRSGGESLYRIPNVIVYNEDGTHKFGSFNVKTNATGKSVLIDKIKSCLSDKDWHCNVGNGVNVRAYDVVLDIMKSLFDIVHNKNKNENELVATITVPVVFSEIQRRTIKNAAENAGFKVDSVITESFASVFYLLKDNLDEEHNALFIDIGGGTLDICLVSVVPEDDSCVIKTESTAGMRFGGTIINDEIINKILIPKYGSELLNALNTSKECVSKWNRYRLNYEIDEFKETVFNEDYDPDEMDKPYEILYAPHESEPLELSISVSEVYNMFKKIKIKEKIADLLDKVINDNSSLLCSEITDVFLIGGTAMIPYFRDVIEDYFRDNDIDDIESLFKLNDDLEYEERTIGAVALGAGNYNLIISAEESSYIIKDKIPFHIYTKNSENRSVTMINADCTYKSYYSLPYQLEQYHISNGRIDVFQVLDDEKKEEIYIGYIPIDASNMNQGYSYRLGVDKNRNVYAEFGLIEGSKNDAEFVSYDKIFMSFDNRWGM